MNELESEPHRSAPSGPAWQAAEAAGHDMALLLESMEMTPAERLRMHELAIERLERLEAAMARKRAGGGSTS